MWCYLDLGIYSVVLTKADSTKDQTQCLAHAKHVLSHVNYLPIPFIYVQRISNNKLENKL